MWRDTKEEYMGLTQLADGLRINKKAELADYVLDTLECKYQFETISSYFTNHALTYQFFSDEIQANGCIL